MSVDQQDGYIAVGNAFRQFEARNVRQPRLDYRKIEAARCQGLSRGGTAMGAGNGRSAELLQSSGDRLTDTVISIYNEKFQHSDGGPHPVSLSLRYDHTPRDSKKFVKYKALVAPPHFSLYRNIPSPTRRRPRLASAILLHILMPAVGRSGYRTTAKLIGLPECCLFD